jgi:ferredoxin-NADP reductase
MSSAWSFSDDRDSPWNVRWDLVPLALFLACLLIGGPMDRLQLFGTGSHLHRIPMKRRGGRVAKLFYLDWVTSLSVKELVLLSLFALALITRYLYFLTLYLHVGRPQPVGRAFGPVLGILLGASFVTPQRSTLFLWVTGMPMERAAMVHKVISVWFYCCCTAKLFAMLVGYAGTPLGASFVFSMTPDPDTPLQADFRGEEEGTTPFFGFLMWTFFTITVIMSQDYIRRKYWELFYFSHIWLMLATCVMSTLHNFGNAFPYYYPGLLLFILDWIIRFYQTCCGRASVTNLESLGRDACKLSIRARPGFKYEAGQYVMLAFSNLPGERNGRVKYHPYSISSAPGDGGEGGPMNEFEIIVKGFGKGTWSQKVCDAAAVFKKEASGLLSVSVAGPHGDLQIRLEKFSYVIMFAGGVGVTPMMSLYMDLFRRRGGDMKKVVLVWAVRDELNFDWYRKEFEKLEEEGAKNEVFEVEKYVTGAGSNRAGIKSGRPDVAAALAEMKKVYCASGAWTPGVAVLTCGPEKMIEDVQDRVYEAQSADCKFALHRETFLL